MTHVRRLLLVLVALLFLAAPTPGDIGCASRSAEDLDPNKFFLAKQQDDCAACNACGFVTQACMRACRSPMGGSFPDQCYPVIHDGDVCLDALEAASCAQYASYVADEGATIPTECDFCPSRDAGPE
jgi:hypothetical protein